MGGVNEKIEGFFRLCQARGLTGEQGVIIPQSNIANLLLNDTVIDAVRAEKFHIYTVANVDQALCLLSGVEAGCADKDNVFSAGSINAAVVERLRSIAELGLVEEDTKE